MNNIPKNIREWVAADVAHAELMLTTDGQVAPLAVMHSADTARAFLMPLSNPTMKKLAFELVRSFCIAWDVEVLVTINECWVATAKRGESIDAYTDRTGSPSQDPTRKEVVLVSAFWRQDNRRRSYCSMHEIERDGSGNPTGLSLDMIKGSGAGEMGGQFAEMFPERRPTREASRRALAALEALPGGMVVKRPQ